LSRVSILLPSRVSRVGVGRTSDVWLAPERRSANLMGKVSRLRRALVTVLHLASLLFTGWALIATSSTEPPHDCFNGIPLKTRLQVIVGAPSSISAGDATLANDGAANADAGAEAAAPPASVPCPAQVTSCNGVDGLVPGTVLLFDVTNERTHASGGGCFPYDTTALSGLPEVTLGAVQRTVSVGPNGPQPYFTTATGLFSSSHSAGCGGTWDLDIDPPGVGSSVVLSPLEVGPNSGWAIYRRIQIHDLQSCDSTFPAGCSSICEDWFAVDRIVQAP
jgi:hypothetical protein